MSQRTLVQHLSRAVRAWLAGGAIPPPDFGGSFNPISTREADYAHLIVLAFPDFQTFWRSWKVLTFEEDLVKIQRYKKQKCSFRIDFSSLWRLSNIGHRDRDYIGIQSRSQSSQTCEISTTQNQSMSSFIWRLIFNRTIIYPTMYSFLSIFSPNLFYWIKSTMRCQMRYFTFLTFSVAF